MLLDIAYDFVDLISVDLSASSTVSHVFIHIFLIETLRESFVVGAFNVQRLS